MGVGDEQVRAFAGFDLLLQRTGDGMAVALGLLEVRLEQAQRQLGIAAVGRVPRVGEGDAQRALVVLGNALVGGARLGAASGLSRSAARDDSADSTAPIPALLGRIEERPAPPGSCPAPVEPGAGQRARQLADGIALAALKCSSAAS